MSAISRSNNDRGKGVKGLDTATIISLVIAACALLFTALSFKRTQSMDTSTTAAERATMTANINYIRQSIDEIKLDNRAIKTDLDELKAKVVAIDASAKSATAANFFIKPPCLILKYIFFRPG